MQKPPTYEGQRLAKNQFTKIVPQATTKSQLFRITELSKYIHHYRLTDALEILEECGVSGDLAIFIVSNLQVLSGGEA